MMHHQSRAAPTSGSITDYSSRLTDFDVMASMMKASHDFFLIIGHNGDSHDPEDITCNR